jgi:hypothetical protein
MVFHATFSVRGAVSGTMRQDVAAAPRRLAWPAAALTIGTLSVGLWLAIGWLVVALV